MYVSTAPPRTILCPQPSLLLMDNKSLGGRDDERRVRMKTSGQLEAKNLYDEDNVVGECMRGRKLREG